MSFSIDSDYHLIIKNNSENEIITYIRKNLSIEELNNFMSELFINYSGKSFKYDNLYNIFNEIFIKFFSDKSNISTTYIFYFLINLIKINKAQLILYKLPFDIKEYVTNHNINNLFSNAVKYSTLPVVIFLSKLCTDDGSISCILRSALYNSDDRVYKYIIKDLGYGIKINTSYGIYANSISGIFNDKIPNKYKLRRIKFISKYFDISQYIHGIICYIRDYDLLYNILKYNLKKQDLDYYTAIKMYDEILGICHNNDFNTCRKQVIQIYDILNSDYEKNLFYITFSIMYSESFNIKFIKDDINYGKYIYKCYIHNLRKLNNRHFIKDIDKVSYYDFIEKIVSEANFDFSILTIYKYVDICSNNLQHKYKYSTRSAFIKLNTAYYYFNRYIIKKTKFYSLQNKIKNIKNNWNNKNTRKSENITSKFNFIPPYHLLPNQLNIINSVIIKEKADGELCFDLPKNIEPNINFSNKIKAEYIEDLDLYLVFDIDIEKNIKERYKYLRSLHPDTKNTGLDVIYDWDDLVNCINIERNKVQKFLNKPYTSYRWYPKSAWEIGSFDTNMVNNLHTIVENSDKIINGWLCNNGPFMNDGFILTPMNGKREIKIKPKNLLTIDLLYQDGNWIDRDEYNYNKIIKAGKFKNNTIYRCYPCNNVYEAKDIRYDKNKPNPRNVVNNLISLYNCNYHINYDKIYYTSSKFKKSVEWNNIVTMNNTIIKKSVLSLKNNNILDLGCGKGKVLNFINKYNSYYGTDYDMSNIVKATIKFNSNKNIFNYINLSRKWDETINKLYTIDTKKYDTIYAINSLMHFCTDDFWEQLSTFTEKNTVFLFNLINNRLDKYTFGEKSFIERCDNNVKYLFEYVHSEPIVEPYISIEKLNYFLDKYNWKIIEEYTPQSNLNKYYTWYKVIRT